MKKFSHYILNLFFIVVCYLIVSCSGNEGGNIQSIEFLGRSGCSHSPTMERNFSTVLEKSGIRNKYKYIDLASLPVDDYRRGFGSPTVLINGKDLFGMPRPMPTKDAPV